MINSVDTVAATITGDKATMWFQIRGSGDHIVTMINPDCGLSWVVNCPDASRAGFDQNNEQVLMDLPSEPFLNGAFPNPFNPSTTITYGLSQESRVIIIVYDMIGQEIVTLVNELQEAGYKSTNWDGKDSFGGVVSSGIYFYRMTVSDPLSPGQARWLVDTKRVLLMK